MILEQNIKAILECNFSIAREEVIESATKRIMEQIKRQILSEVDYTELRDRFGEEVEFVVRDMINGTGDRWKENKQ